MSAMGCYPNRDGKDRHCSSNKWSVEILLNSTDHYLRLVDNQNSLIDKGKQQKKLGFNHANNYT